MGFAVAVEMDEQGALGRGVGLVTAEAGPSHVLGRASARLDPAGTSVGGEDTEPFTPDVEDTDAL